jgi:hypothetical protein
MTEPRSILVPIDLYGINRRTLETLVRIARQLDRSLLGLLLEDLRLQQVADLPFTTEITLGSGRERSLLRDHLSQRHSVVSTDTRRLLNELAERNRVALSFEHATGARWHAAQDRDGQLDIFFPARQRWHAAAADYAGGRGIIKRLGVVMPPGTLSASILNTAAALVHAGLVGDIYILSNRPLLPEQLHDLYHNGHQVRLQSNFACDAASLVGLIRQSPYDLLLLPHACLRDIPPEILEAALDKSGGQVLVVS